MIEFITYRIGDHSTSDHSVLYRAQEEIDSWKTQNNPITRLGLYLKQSGKRNFSEDDEENV
jgi:2-oxoisovalerate dehydrogenase E1 component alpha subunit